MAEVSRDGRGGAWPGRIAFALVFLGVAAAELPGVLARVDDGRRDARRITCEGVDLAWAPTGPGWNLRRYLSGTARVSWTSRSMPGGCRRRRRWSGPSCTGSSTLDPYDLSAWSAWWEG